MGKLRPVVDLELVGDVHEHTQVHVEDRAGVHVSGYAVLVLIRVLHGRGIQCVF